MGADEILFFVHTPKCAGSSFMEVLATWFGDDLLRLDALHEQDLASAISRRGKQPKAVGGHFLYGVHAALPCKARYISLVRNPVDRFVSLYKHARRIPDHLFHAAATSLDLEGFLEFSQVDRRASRQIRGIQCYFLSRERAFDRAKAIVDRDYYVIAPTESFSDFTSKCSQLVDGAPIIEVRANVSAQDARLETDAALLASRIRAANPEDQLLFEHVQRSFQAEICA